MYLSSKQETDTDIDPPHIQDSCEQKDSRDLIAIFRGRRYKHTGILVQFIQSGF